MSINVVVINGRYRQVTNVVSRASVVTVDCVTGFTSKKALAGKLPGPGWRTDTAYKFDPKGPKHWIKNEPTVERVTVDQHDFLELDVWPTREYDAKEMAELVSIIRPHIDRAIDQGGVHARRVCPKLRVETVELAITSAGLPLPPEEQYETALKEAWQAAVPKEARGKATKSIIGKVAPRPPEPAKPAPMEKTDSTHVLETIERKAPPDGYYYSEQLTKDVPDNEENHLIDDALANGWPFDKLAGASKTRKGTSGFTLKYATKNAYDPKVHGAA